MFDPTMVITSVQQNQYSPQWRVIQGKGNAGCIIGAIFFSILGTTTLLFLCIGGFFSAMARTFFDSLSTLFVLLLFFGVILFSIAAPMIGVVLWFKHKDKQANNSLLVLMPEGVIDYEKGTPDRVNTLYFPNIRKIEMDKQAVVYRTAHNMRSSISYWLNVYDTAGGYTKWPLHGCYGDPAITGGSIIATYEYYQQQQIQHP